MFAERIVPSKLNSMTACDRSIASSLASNSLRRAAARALPRGLGNLIRMGLVSCVRDIGTPCARTLGGGGFKTGKSATLRFTITVEPATEAAEKT